MTDIELFDYLKQKAYNEHSLFQVEIDVTSACNAKCPFCFQGVHENIDDDKMPLSKMIELLDELRKMGTYYIGFSGGEPFMRNDFLEILREAKKRLFRVSLITNGMLLDEKKIIELAAISVERVTVSFHSCIPDHYCQSFGITDKEMMKKVTDNISLLLKHGISTGIAMTVSSINISDVEETTNYLVKLGIDEKDINYNMLLSGKSVIANIRPSDDQVRKVKNFLEKKNSNEKERKLLCSAGTISCSIDSKGNVYPCTFFNSSAGNIDHKTLTEIWNDSHLLTIIRNLKEDMFTKCHDCSIKGKCGLCIATNLNETKNIFNAPNEFCTSRKARMGVI